MQSIIKHLSKQGAPNAQPVFHALSLSGLATAEATPATVAALLIGVTAAPFSNLAQYVADRLYAATDTGETFGDALCSILSAVPSQITASQISINQEQPFARISHLDGDVVEYETGNLPQSIRHDVVISGGTIAMLCMKLNGPPTESGWKE
jgi:hypothetical protein